MARAVGALLGALGTTLLPGSAAILAAEPGAVMAVGLPGASRPEGAAVLSAEPATVVAVGLPGAPRPEGAAVLSAEPATVVAVGLPGASRPEGAAAPTADDGVFGAPDTPARRRQDRLEAALAAHCFVAYSPRTLVVRGNETLPATVAGMQQDLALLGRHFDALISYSARNGQEQLPRLARAAGFRALILGVWNPADAAEVDAAVAAAREDPSLVLAVALGNEGLHTGRYRVDALLDGLAALRRRLPAEVLVTTTDTLHAYRVHDGAAFWAAQDFLLPTVHPLYAPDFDPDAPEAAAAYVVAAVRDLARRSGRRVLVKETGLPAGPPGSAHDPARQAAFWSALDARMPRDPAVGFAWFEAFDLPWKPPVVEAMFGGRHPEEAWWGLHDVDGRPRPALAVAARRCADRGRDTTHR